MTPEISRYALFLETSEVLDAPDAQKGRTGYVRFPGRH
jgi:hypothetical protein